MTARKPVLPDLQAIPGVGPSVARALNELGYLQVPDLVDQDAEQMFARLCALRGERVDRCVLYIFRCVSYFASRTRHDPELLKWWNWTDQKLGS